MVDLKGVLHAMREWRWVFLGEHIIGDDEF